MPALHSECSLVSVAERVTWSQAMARHLLDRVQSERTDPLPDWKVDELVAPTNRRLQVLLAHGVTNAAAIEHYFFDRDEENRSDYATGQ
ncbi:MAG: hypothetical protein WC617_12395 [Rhodanobacter sp.]|jgi:hypothetical protein